MVKVIIGHKVKTGADIEPLLLKFRALAREYPGFVNSEDLISEKDGNVVVTISTWDKDSDWKECENSIIRQQLYQDVYEIMEDKPRIQMYRVPEVRRRN